MWHYLVNTWYWLFSKHCRPPVQNQSLFDSCGTGVVLEHLTKTLQRDVVGRSRGDLPEAVVGSLGQRRSWQCLGSGAADIIASHKHHNFNCSLVLLLRCWWWQTLARGWGFFCQLFGLIFGGPCASVPPSIDNWLLWLIQNHHHYGSRHERKVQFFWTLFKRPLTPPFYLNICPILQGVFFERVFEHLI